MKNQFCINWTSNKDVDKNIHQKKKRLHCPHVSSDNVTLRFHCLLFKSFSLSFVEYKVVNIKES